MRQKVAKQSSTLNGTQYIQTNVCIVILKGDDV